MKLLSDNIREEAVEPEVLGAEKALELARKPRKRFPLWLGYGVAGLLVISLASKFSEGFGPSHLVVRNSGASVQMEIPLPSGAVDDSPSVNGSAISSQNNFVGRAGPLTSRAPAPKTDPDAPSGVADNDVQGGANTLSGSIAQKASPADSGRMGFSYGNYQGGALGQQGQGGFGGGTFARHKAAQMPADTGVDTPKSPITKGSSTDYAPTGQFGTPATPKPSASAKYLTPPSNRKIIQDGEVEVEVADVGAAQNSAAQLAVSVNGFAENSSLDYSDNTAPTASITLRVPAQKFAYVMQRVEELGKVKSNNVTGEDVTAQYADTDARLKELTAEADDYVTMLRGARSIGQILEIKDRLSQVRQEINSMHEQLDSLKDQSSLSTLNITFDQKGAPKPPAPKPKPLEDKWADDTFKHATEGLTSALHFLARGVIVLFVYSPIWLTIALIAWLINRRRKS